MESRSKEYEAFTAVIQKVYPKPVFMPPNKGTFALMFESAIEHAKGYSGKKTLEEKASDLMIHWYKTGLEYSLSSFDSGFIANYSRACVWAVYLRKEHEIAAKRAAKDGEDFDQFIERAFDGSGYAPADLKAAARRICFAYGIRGICDPMYIVNTIAHYTGRGDGKSNFGTKCDDTRCDCKKVIHE